VRLSLFSPSGRLSLSSVGTMLRNRSFRDIEAFLLEAGRTHHGSHFFSFSPPSVVVVVFLSPLTGVPCSLPNLTTSLDGTRRIAFLFFFFSLETLRRRRVNNAAKDEQVAPFFLPAHPGASEGRRDPSFS